METKTTSVPVPAAEDLIEEKKPTSLLIAQFFLFPLIIIGICVGIFLFFGYMTYRPGTISEYLDDVRFGAGTQEDAAVTGSPDCEVTPQVMTRAKQTTLTLRNRILLKAGEGPTELQG